MKQMEAPKCRLCEKNHWAREGCYGMLMHGGSAGGSMAKDSQRVAMIGRAGEQPEPGAHSSSTPAAATSRPGPNLRREGRRVLKGSTPKTSGAKPTRSASTEKADPTTPAKAPADSATEEKAGLGNPKPRMAKKKGRKKK